MKPFLEAQWLHGNFKKGTILKVQFTTSRLNVYIRILKILN